MLRLNRHWEIGDEEEKKKKKKGVKRNKKSPWVC